MLYEVITDDAGAEFAVDVIVGDHRDLTTQKRQHHALADEVGVALVLGVDGDRRVAEHRLGAGGGDDEEARLALDRVT